MSTQPIAELIVKNELSALWKLACIAVYEDRIEITAGRTNSAGYFVPETISDRILLSDEPELADIVEGINGMAVWNTALLYALMNDCTLRSDDGSNLVITLSPDDETEDEASHV